MAEIDPTIQLAKEAKAASYNLQDASADAKHKWYLILTQSDKHPLVVGGTQGNNHASQQTRLRGS
jgi:hypothetical protein